MNIYSILKDNTDFNSYKPYIHELLDLIIKHRITPSIYLIFILENLEKNNISFELVKDKLRKIVYIPSYKEDLEEINDQEELFVYISESTVLDVDVISKIEDIVAEIQVTKNIVLEINLEQTIT